MTTGPPMEKKQKGERKKKKKRKVEADSDEPIPKKKKAKGTLSATLGRAPDAESLPVPGVPPGATLMAVEWRTSLDEQLEAHLLGTEPPATVAQQSQTTASLTAPQGLDMGGFLARLRKSIPQAGTQQAVVTTPVLRQSKQTWIPVPVAEARTTRPLTVREILARQAVKEIPKGSLLEAPQPTALRSPRPGRFPPQRLEGKSPLPWMQKHRRNQQCPQAEW